MRVLLTGAGGFVGHHTLVHVLKTTDWQVVATDSFRHRGTTARLRSVRDECPDFDQRVTVITHDLTAPIDTVTNADLGEVDLVISMASESHVDRSITHPRSFVENNVNLALTLLEWARTRDLAAFLHVSTDEVYGAAPDGHAHSEWESVLPSNPYSASKAAQEAIATSYWRTYRVPVVLTNTMNIIGERQDVEKFVPSTIRKVLDGETVQIHGDPTSGRVGARFYLHARNQADALIWLLTNRTPAQFGEADRPDRWHVVGERELTNLEMADLIADALGRSLRHEIVDFHSSRPGHDLRYALDGTKLAAAGWKPPVPLEESLRRTAQWTAAHLEWLR